MNTRWGQSPGGNVIGFTGKIPDKPDFISRYLPSNFLSFWDTWIDQGMSQSQSSLGAQWQERFLIAPVWQFSILPGQLGETGWVGVIIPSMDGVGRYYPLTVASAYPFSHHHFPEAEVIFERLEGVAISALDEGVSINDLEDLCHQECLSQAETLPHFSHPQKVVPDRSALSLTLRPGADELQLAISGLASDQILKSPVCFWSSGSPHVQPAVHYLGSLPGPDFFVDLLSESPNIKCPHMVFRPERVKRGQSPLPRAMPANQKGPWISAARSHPGQREINQDAFLQNDLINLWAIADGMGGHEAGERASRLVIEGLNTLAPARHLETTLGRIIRSLNESNQSLQKISEMELGGSVTGSTFVGLVLGGDVSTCIWVGDSRLYRLRSKKLELMMTDHNYQTAEGRTVLARAVGGTLLLDVDTRTGDLLADDQFLLCSDGLYRSVSEPDMARLLEETDLDTAADNLLNLAISQGAKDNVTLIIVRRNHTS